MIIVHQESKDSKYKIFIDYNIVKIGEKLRELGYAEEFYPGTISDGDIHKGLNAMRKVTKSKPIILITKDFDDFEKFESRGYHIVGITNDRIDEKKAAEKIRQSLISNNDGRGFPDGFVTKLK
jgi:uncharacterized protein with PIN domain